jgi:hypothetical protein
LAWLGNPRPKKWVENDVPNTYVRSCDLIVFPPGVTALGATEETDLALISTPQLAQPPEGEGVSTLRAQDIGRRESLRLLLIVDDGNLLLDASGRDLHIVLALDRLNIPAPTAFHLTTR